MFDDVFSTVTSISNNDPPPNFWNEIDIDEFMYIIPLGDYSVVTLNDEWLTPQEREEKECAQVKQVQLRARYQPDPNSTLAPTMFIIQYLNLILP